MHTAHGFSSRLQPSLIPPPPLRKVFSLVCSLSSPGKPLWLSIAHDLLPYTQPNPLPCAVLSCYTAFPLVCHTVCFSFCSFPPLSYYVLLSLPLLTFYYNLRPSPWLHYTCSTLLPMASSCIACPSPYEECNHTWPFPSPETSCFESIFSKYIALPSPPLFPPLPFSSSLVPPRLSLYCRILLHTAYTLVHSASPCARPSPSCTAFPLSQSPHEPAPVPLPPFLFPLPPSPSPFSHSPSPIPLPLSF